MGELETASGGFTAAVQQLCNVATLPGKHCTGGHASTIPMPAVQILQVGPAC